MNTHPVPRSGLVRRRLAPLAVATILFGAAAACSSGTTDDNAGDGPANDAAKQAAARVDTLSAAHDAAPKIDADAIDTSGLSGRTVYYVPIALKAGHFPIIETNLKEAFAEVGMKVQACDGQANPSGVSACLDQAIAAKPAAVITDYIPYEMAGTAMERVVDAGIPVYVGGAPAPEGKESTPQFAFDNPDSQGLVLQEGSGDATIADSNAEANVLYLRVIDSPTTKNAGDHAVSYLEANCPDCKVTVKDVRLAQIKDVSSLVSSAVLTDPSIDYVMPQYDTYLSVALAGLQSSGKAKDVKLTTTGATLAAVQQVKSNPQLVAVVGVNPPYLAWTIADSTLRLIAGELPPKEYPSLARAFTKDNIDDIELDAANETSGAWFGDPQAFKSAFTQLWGVQ